MPNKIIVALDGNSAQVEALIAQLKPQECILKVGITLFTHQGPTWVKNLIQQGFDIFLDLKFHDIPQQVAGACYEAARLGVWMINLHALGGLAMLTAARKSIEKLEKRPLLIGVTLLTSADVTELQALGIQESPAQLVERLAQLCFDAGLDGVVCSAHEVSNLKQRFGTKFLCVTPGIRGPQDAVDDQVRIMTPAQAITQGSDYLVIGRPISAHPEPAQALLAIQASIEDL